MTHATGKQRIQFTLDSEGIAFTTVTADEVSVDFWTTDREGEEMEPSFELTWAEVLEACREYMK